MERVKLKEREEKRRKWHALSDLHNTFFAASDRLLVAEHDKVAVHYVLLLAVVVIVLDRRIAFHRLQQVLLVAQQVRRQRRNDDRAVVQLLRVQWHKKTTSQVDLSQVKRQQSESSRTIEKETETSDLLTW